MFELSKTGNRNPLNLFKLLDREFEDISRGLDGFHHFHGLPTMRGIVGANFSPSLDFSEKENKHILSLEVPGIKQDDIDIEVLDNTLIIKGEKEKENKNDTEETYICERYYGKFRREVPLPKNSNTNDIEANYKNGVLTINIPKKEKEKPKIKKIKIKN